MTIHYLNRNSYSKKPKSRGYKIPTVKDNYRYQVPKRNKNNAEFSNKNLTLQILSGSALVCFCFLFVQSFLAGTTTTAVAGSLSNKEIQLFTNFKNEQSQTNAIVTAPVLEEINTQSSSSSSSESSDEITPVAQSYIVAKGDTIFDISKKTGVSLVKIITANNIDDSGTINVGQTLIIP
jgi:LysM repeat protein